MAAIQIFKRFRQLLDVDWSGIADGQLLERSGDNITGTDAVSADLNPNLQVLTENYTVPANKSLVFVDSLTMSNNTSITIPSTGAIQVLGPSVSTPSEVTLKTTGDYVCSSVATFVPIPTLRFAGSANKVYEVDILLIGNSSSSAGGKFSLFYSGSSTGEFTLLGSITSEVNNTGVDYHGINSVTNIGNTWTTASVDNITWMKGILRTTTAGILTMQVFKNTSGTITINKGSRMTVTTLV